MRRSGNNFSRELLELKRLLADQAVESKQNLDSDLGALRYIDNAKVIKKIMPQGKILDWGCGLGHMTYLLRNRGFEVISYDVDQGGKDFLARIGQTLILATDPVKLPFADGSFDAVLSSGVLEHVPDPAASLKEVSRTIKNGGFFFLFRLPNRYSYIEFISDRLGRGDHPIKYSRRQMINILNKAGYEVLASRYQGFLPHNLKGFPALVRRLYHGLDPLWKTLDAFLTACPGLNVLCTNIELVARKK